VRIALLAAKVADANFRTAIKGNDFTVNAFQRMARLICWASPA
jgi:hypothetical protein